jgi:hypothetical protein
MSSRRGNLSRATVAAFLALGTMSATDLSSYRSFQLGTDLTAVAKQIGALPSEAKVIHSRPALIQELVWRPQPLGPSSETEPANEVVFSFYEGQLFRMAISYDRYETEGLTTGDFVEAISGTYGVATKPTVAAERGLYSNDGQLVAQWQDSLYRFDLIRLSYGPSFNLVGVLKRLEATAKAAGIEAERLDYKEAPQREANRKALDDESERAKLQKARVVNKPKFRP